MSIAEIKARLAAATPGPWNVAIRKDAHPVARVWWIVPSKIEVDYETYEGNLIAECGYMTDATALFIANAPTDIARLIRALELAIEQRDGWINNLPDNFHKSYKRGAIEQSNAAIDKILGNE